MHASASPERTLCIISTDHFSRPGKAISQVCVCVPRQ